MALNNLIDSQDLRFVLFEMLGADELTRFEKFSALDRDTFEATLELAEQLATEKLYPANAESDKTGAVYDPETKSVAVPAAFKEVMKYFNEAGFTGIATDPEWGGMGFPEVLSRGAMEYFFAASLSFTCYVSLAVGAVNLFKNFAPDELKNLYIEKMIAGRWGGTMCLTEPDAGSDVGSLKTKAVKQPDGSYRITGQKIFITGGENDLYENIVHPVLARIEGDPPGTKGISIFLVPKFLANPDGSIGKRNDLACTGIEHKMGIRGSATSSLSFGDNGECVGWLMGEERQGMKIMFQMMNEARLDVALEGLAVSSSAYLHAVSYAKNRVQGMNPLRREKSPSPIVDHPDVRRMLLWMKSNVEAMRMATLFAACCADISRAAGGEEAREAKALLDFLIPVCKAGNTDLAWLVTGEAIQVLGGYGYCGDYPVEQLARDAKILTIWEGTNGIQSLDLTFRKLLMNPDMYNYTVYKKRMRDTIGQARETVDARYVSMATRGIEIMEQVVEKLARERDAGNMGAVYAAATPLQQGFRMLTHAWMHLWSLTICIPKLNELSGGLEGEELTAFTRDNTDGAFYHGKVLSGRFYLGTELHRFFGLAESILDGETAVTDSFAGIFTGAPE